MIRLTGENVKKNRFVRLDIDRQFANIFLLLFPLTRLFIVILENISFLITSDRKFYFKTRIIQNNRVAYSFTIANYFLFILKSPY